MLAGRSMSRAIGEPSVDLTDPGCRLRKWGTPRSGSLRWIVPAPGGGSGRG